MTRPLSSACEQDTVTCERTWSEVESWTLHSAIAKKRNRQSTSSRTVPSGGNRDTSYSRRRSQPPTSCGERRKTCPALPSSWQHVDWGSKHSWLTAEEEEKTERVKHPALQVAVKNRLLFLACLAPRPQQHAVYLRNAPSQTISHAAILRYKLQIKFAVSLVAVY